MTILLSWSVKSDDLRKKYEKLYLNMYTSVKTKRIFFGERDFMLNDHSTIKINIYFYAYMT